MAANYQYQEEISESEEEADDFQETKRKYLIFEIFFKY